MAGAKEIRTKIKSIKSTQKITRAMEMVAASKMRKAQDRMRASRPFAERIRRVVDHLATGRLEYKHPFLEEREPKHVGFIIITTDRGLCGGLNVNLLRAAVQEMRKWDQKGVKVSLCTIGRKAESFFRKYGGDLIASIVQIGDKPSLHDVIGPVKVMLDAYMAEDLDRIILIYNDFINTMTQRPHIELLVPIVPTEDTIEKQKFSWDYIYEPPNPQELIDTLLNRYVESLVYQGLVENAASEQAARMVAMKSASDNAMEIIQDLQLRYNKARQASITQELSEIVAGAAAV